MTKPSFSEEDFIPVTKVIREIQDDDGSKYLHLVARVGAAHLFLQDNRHSRHIAMRNQLYGKWTETYSLELDDTALDALLQVLDEIRAKRRIPVPQLELPPIVTEGAFQVQERRGGRGIYLTILATDNYATAVQRGAEAHARTRADIRIVTDAGKTLKKWGH